MLQRNDLSFTLTDLLTFRQVCTSVNEVIWYDIPCTLVVDGWIGCSHMTLSCCNNSHGIPDYREVQSGDIVNIDISVYNEG
jgi:methionine aminopeptidase